MNYEFEHVIVLDQIKQIESGNLVSKDKILITLWNYAKLLCEVSTDGN